MAQSKFKFKVTMEEYTQRGQKGIGVWLGGRFDEKSEPTSFFAEYDINTENEELLSVICSHYDQCKYLQQNGLQPLKKMEIK